MNGKKDATQYRQTGRTDGTDGRDGRTGRRTDGTSKVNTQCHTPLLRRHYNTYTAQIYTN